MIFEDLKSEFEKLISHACDQIPRNSTPGFPWCVVASVNKKIMDVEVTRKQFESEALDRIERILRVGVERMSTMTAEELISAGLCDPIKAFIKDEPHARRKVLSGKFRIISGVSVLDQVIDRVLFACQNKLEIMLWDEIPSKPGIGLNDEGLRKMATWFSSVLAKGGKLVSTDVSGWDWSVKAWLLYADYLCRVKLCNGEGSVWAYLARARVLCISRKMFVFPDSTLSSQRIDGIQASGSYNTSSTNSRMRGFLRAVAYVIDCLRRGVEVDEAEFGRFVAMGDDCVEGELAASAYELISEMGFLLKDLAFFEQLEGVEFCSHRWYSDGLARPVNWGKTLFRFAQQPNNPIELPGLIDQLEGDFRNLRGLGSEDIQEVIAYKLKCAKDGN